MLFLIVSMILISSFTAAKALPFPPEFTPENLDTPIDDIYHTIPMDRALRDKWMASFDGMMEQLSTTMMEQVLIIGTFMDAKHQLESQRLLQTMDTDIRKEMEPSVQMCIMGTNVRSLAASEQKADTNAYILGNALLNRSMLPYQQITGLERDDNYKSRIAQYTKTYCDNRDNSNALTRLCTDPVPKARMNRDLDFTSLIDGPLTLNIDFTDSDLTNDEEDILALSHNLFNNDIFGTIPQDLITQGPLQNMGPGAWVFQNMRSLQAVRGIAENSFAHIVGMKAQGSDFVYPYMSQIVQELGVPPDDIAKLLGGNPSYFAQMDVLTKRIYMSPNFFVNLFTQPVNVERMGVTLQAINLMQDRDRYEASLRREMLISMIVEMKLRELEKSTNSKIMGTLPNLLMGTPAAGP